MSWKIFNVSEWNENRGTAMHFLPLVFTSIKPQSHCIKPIELDEISCEGLLLKITDTRETKINTPRSRVFLYQMEHFIK